ncbi:MAG: hypothetical protein AB1635_03860 [Acidobacteriota bacterium]
MGMMAPVLVSMGGFVLSRDPLGGLAVLVLYAIWRLVRHLPGPPVVLFALTYQWGQCAIGLFYGPLTGRALLATTAPEYRFTVLISLLSVLGLAIGFRVGYNWARRRWPERAHVPELFSTPLLIAAYVVSLFATISLQAIAWYYPLFTQALVALSMVRLGVFYLTLRRLVIPDVRFAPAFALVVFEVGIGFTGFFANFREPLLLTALVAFETFDPRRLSNWVGVGAVAAAAVVAGVFWMGVRGEYRQDFAEVEQFAESRSLRVDRLQELAADWLAQDSTALLLTVDFLIDRIWAVYYPALAVARVPALLPHTNGEIIFGALRHIATPRALFPDKPPLPSDSEMVRRYSGVMVAGEEANTSIAFGYVAESYVDFGVPVMFVPMLVWGMFLGVSYQVLRYMVRHQDLLIPLLAVVFWLSMFVFERSWVKTLGLTGTLLIYVGGLAYLLDRWLVQRFVAHGTERQTADDDALTGVDAAMPAPPLPR